MAFQEQGLDKGRDNHPNRYAVQDIFVPKIVTLLFVELTFERAPGSCFELASEFIADSIC
ncbi:MAG TPA: hypothetical protein VFQ06_10515 [Nitrospira sp.]|jgi:hypothetical protein|nr:hypothetical protein [Nitrospira sp.]